MCGQVSQVKSSVNFCVINYRASELRYGAAMRGNRVLGRILPQEINLLVTVIP